MSQPNKTLPRGAIKAFREHLNREDLANRAVQAAKPEGDPSRSEVMHREGRYRQMKRPYGDYLYAQDRERFMVDLQDWLAEGGMGPNPAR